MSSDDFSHRQEMMDSLRGTLLAQLLRSVGDDLVELLDGTAIEQTLGRSMWITEREAANGLGRAIEKAIDEFQARLAVLGVVGEVYIASTGGLFDKRRNCRSRLYGDRDGEPCAQDHSAPGSYPRS